VSTGQGSLTQDSEVDATAIAAPTASEPSSRATSAHSHGSTGSEGPSRLAALSGLRIIAALAVYMSHVGPPHSSPAVLGSFIESGYMGVTIFFVLSGFVLALNYFESLTVPNARYIWRYIVARFARIYPLYILILFYILVHRHAFGENIEGWWVHVVALQAWSPNLAQAYNFNGPAWSVSVEFFLYACFPFLVVVLSKLRTSYAIMVMFGLVVVAMTGLTAWFAITGRGGLPWVDPGSAHRWLYRTPLTRLGDFTLGILAARLYARNRGRTDVVRACGLLAVGASLVIVGLMAWSANLFSVWSWDLAYAVPAVLVIFGISMAPRSIPARLLSLPLIVLLGESSYAFYLIHQTALGYLDGNRWSVGTSPTTILYEAFVLGGILCAAVGLHIVVERPARRYIRRLAERPSEASRQSPWHGPPEVLP
jgi:peptidoglycan/LPS O-acetylase OafA/YrhL